MKGLAWLTLGCTNWKQRSQLSITCTGQHQNKIPRKVVDLRKISKIFNHNPLPILPPEIYIYPILPQNCQKPLLNFSHLTWICSWTIAYWKQSNSISAEKRMFSNRFIYRFAWKRSSLKPLFLYFISSCAEKRFKSLSVNFLIIFPTY